MRGQWLGYEGFSLIDLIKEMESRIQEPYRADDYLHGMMIGHGYHELCEEIKEFLIDDDRKGDIKMIAKVGELYVRKGVYQVDRVGQGLVKMHSVTDEATLEMPSEMFERNYERAPETASLGKTYDLGIGDAVQLMEHGYLVARDGWNTKRMWIGMQKPASHSRMTVPYLYLEYPVGHPACPNGCRVPWLPSQTDLLAKDYQVVRLGE